jgi:hypothetical protein
VIAANTPPLGYVALPLSDPAWSVITNVCAAAPPAPQQSQVPLIVAAPNAPDGAKA